ncbi:hypothetical protein C9J03_09570 [Photobacterium gaetbulicola]|uniref:Type 4 fimbrial biogenesis protein PilX N-terminal domain-containing protein n=1 Tax=Photobacterium gaetbulicola Gung47 TaxID=658445 RepID=A0A0C5WTS4_9GAMM|nr:hypothetical protein [Photobacterium gaetbulicola]AJR09762.1 hypothetical protein H744_2c3118 [Photobacterium gaetbulicola Gung47]PSU12280.1 hypothetical protein C9J03_09570 [Photobacterium gaetbulicola]
MQKQRGLTTLLVTTMILLISSVLSLASYKNVFYQIKRTQNEVLARQAHWLAEGGMECGLTTIFNSPNPENAHQPGFFPNGCTTGLGVDLVAVKDASTYELTSQYIDRAKATLKKSISILSSGKSGAIQTGSNMYAHSSLAIYNPEPGKFTGEGWQCVAVRYRDKYEPTASIANYGLLAKPDPSFDNKGKDCLASHKTMGTGIEALKEDFVHDPSMSPFEDFFGVSDQQHNQVRDDYFDVVITETTSPSGNDFEYSGMTNCSAAILEALTKGHEKIWVEGSCEVAGVDFENVAKESQRLDGVLILVHDGLFSLFPNNGDKSEKYNGLLFHYNVDYQYDFSDWEGSKAFDHLNHPSSVFGDKVDLASYYLHGSLNINGGVILDAKHYDISVQKFVSQNALLFDSFALTYNGSYFDKFEGGPVTVKWMQGTWHDF